MNSSQVKRSVPLMSDFISHEFYRKNEHYHAGWKEAIGVIARTLITLVQPSQQPRLFEFGSGPGTSSLLLAEFLRSDWGRGSFSIQCLDNDPLSILEMGRVITEEQISELSPVLADVLNMETEDSSYDACFSVFAISHLRDCEKAPLIRKLCGMAHSGITLVCDEFLPSSVDKKEAYWKHHSAIMFDAAVNGRSDLAHIEMEALFSGLHEIGDFKMEPGDFEAGLHSLGLAWSKCYCFPILGDLTPTMGASSPQEVEAQTIWASLSGELFEELSNPPCGDRLFPPLGAYHSLENICRRLASIPRSGRAGRVRDCSDFVWRDETPASEDNWGVIVYAIWDCASGAEAVDKLWSARESYEAPTERIAEEALLSNIRATSDDS